MGRREVPGVSYEEDFVLWLEQQVSLLRARQFGQLDIDNLVAELEAMTGRDRRELSRRLKVVPIHLLKCQYQPKRKSSSWLNTLAHQRDEIAPLLQDSPSLVGDIPALARRRYRQAVLAAARETRLPPKAFPTELPLQRSPTAGRRLRAVNSARSHKCRTASLIVAALHAIIAGFPFPHSS